MSVLSASSGVTRRTVVTAAGAVAVTALGGCAAYGRAATSPGGSPPTPAGSPAAPAGSPPAPAGSPPAPGAGVAPLARTSDIPVGGGVVFPDAQVVITQPRPGRFVAFSAVCTHQGCVVNEVAGGTINCPCHGSRFAVADGSVSKGPARRPLPPVQVAEQDGALQLV